MAHRVVPYVKFIGDRPTENNISRHEPFVGTKSYKTLLDWIYKLDVSVSRCLIHNAYNIKGEAEIINVGSSDKVVALGENARDRLVELGIDHFALPHPSGMNRKLNDKKALDKLLSECKDWLYDTCTATPKGY